MNLDPDDERSDRYERDQTSEHRRDPRLVPRSFAMSALVFLVLAFHPEFSFF
jgi:hypothetical protein